MAHSQGRLNAYQTTALLKSTSLPENSAPSKLAMPPQNSAPSKLTSLCISGSLQIVSTAQEPNDWVDQARCRSTWLLHFAAALLLSAQVKLIGCGKPPSEALPVAY